MTDYLKDFIADIRANQGQSTSGMFKGRPMIILTTTGAKSGQPRTVPLVYSRESDHYLIAASKGGAPSHPGWYHNLLADPHVTVEIDGESFPATASVAAEPERRRLYDQHADAHLGLDFRGYETKTTRVIPVVLLEREASGES